MKTLTEQLLAERDKGPIDSLLVEAAKSDIERGIDARSSASSLQRAMLASLQDLPGEAEERALALRSQQDLFRSRPSFVGMGAAPMGLQGLFGAIR